MGQLIDLCGTPIQLDKVKEFRLVKRECLYYPAYQEVADQSFSLFARLGSSNKKKFQFTKHVPFGILLGEKEKPSLGSYEIKSFGEATALHILEGAEKVVGGAASWVADMLRIDASGSKEYRILTQGRRLEKVRLRNIPAKVTFLSGKVSDVYKNDSIYEFLGEPIAPTVVVVPTLVVVLEKTNYVFFGGGFDIEDAEGVYHSLFGTYNQFLVEREKSMHMPTLPKFSMNLPKLNMPTIKLQSPFVIKKAAENIAEEQSINAEED